MGEIVKDTVFGEMEYKHRWIKQEVISLLGKDRKLNIIALAYSGDQICDEQRTAYTKFKEKIDKINRRIPDMIEEYVENHIEDIAEHFTEIESSQDVIAYVIPKSVMFARDGKTVIMCDVKWDEENGIGIEVAPEYKVDVQDVFL